MITASQIYKIAAGVTSSDDMDMSIVDIDGDMLEIDHIGRYFSKTIEQLQNEGYTWSGYETHNYHRDFYGNLVEDWSDEPSEKLHEKYAKPEYLKWLKENDRYDK